MIRMVRILFFCALILRTASGMQPRAPYKRTVYQADFQRIRKDDGERETLFLAFQGKIREK